MLLAIVLLLAIGVVVGGAGMRRAGRLVGRVTGPWRPALGGLSLVSLIGALALAARGAVLEAGLLLFASLGLAGGARFRRAPPAADGDMSLREACDTLGVSASASREEVDAAYRRLMRRVHPDVGGAAGLAARLNLAREVLGRRPKGA